MTRKQIIHTLALAEHARGISALNPALSGFYDHWLTLIPPAHLRLVRDYNATFGEIAKQGAAYFEKSDPRPSSPSAVKNSAV